MFEELEQALKTPMIRIDVSLLPHDEKKGPLLTFMSSLEFMVIQLKNIEYKVKSMILPMGSLYTSRPLNLISQDFRVVELLTNIAPPYLPGLQPDYYVIIRWLLSPTIPRLFNEVQGKQWLSYYKEIQALSIFYTLPSIRVLDLSSIISEKVYQTYFINFPMEKLETLSTCSDTTFSGIISALNILIPFFWSIMFEALHNYRKFPIPQLPPPPPPMPSAPLRK